MTHRVVALVAGLVSLAGCARVVFQHRELSGSGGSGGDAQVYSMRVDGTDRTNLSAGRARSEYSPDVRQDGKKIVFLAGANEIHVMDADGGNAAAVPNAPRDAGAPRWSRGGSFIVFSHPASTMQSAIYVIQADGSGLTQVTHPSGTQKDEVAEAISDKFVVFTRYDAGNGHDRDLWVKYLWDSRPEVRLTHTPDQAETLPVVSHDGRTLAFRAVPASGRDFVQLARLDSPESITLLGAVHLAPPADINISGVDFTKSDQELLVTVQASDVPGSLVDRKQEMFRVRLDGTGQRRLTEDEAEDVGPSAVP